MENKENALVVRQSPKKPRSGPLGPVNDPQESDMLDEILRRKAAMGEWKEGKTTSKGRPLGGRRRKTRKSKKPLRRKTRKTR